MDANWFEKILRRQPENRVEKVLEVHFSPAVGRGENFMSSIRRVTLSIVLRTGEKSMLSLILKEIYPTKARGDVIRESGVFSTEIEVYQEVLDKMTRLMKETGDLRENIWPVLVFSHPYDTIVLEDLCAKGFNVIDRKSLLDFDHSNLIMKELGRFHAMSQALVRRGDVDPSRFADMVFLRDKFLHLRFSSALHPLAHALQNHWMGGDWQEIGRRVYDIKPILEGKLKELIESGNPKFNVLNHGDCWTSNLMFKHDKSGQPIEVKFVDFQLAHYNSFAFDLTYHLYSCVRPTERRKYFDRLLIQYRQSLLENMAFFGVDASIAPSEIEVKSEMNRLRFYGFILLTSIFAVTTADNENLDIEDLAKDAELATAFRQQLFASDKYINYVSKDFHTFAMEGVI